jgi:lipopolysaccharide/colanic/teichoic acid biosynthesis glycosyltransferase
VKQTGLPLLAKRVVDMTVASAALVLTAPILGAAAAAVATTLGRPVLFTQQRPGKGGRPIRIFKLRTMTNERDAQGQLLPDEQRLGPLGKILRAASIDDLPNLFNVLAGDLSLVGPRPLLMSYLPLYSPEQARRHEVLPGITGWAQVHGRNALSHEDKFRLDVWYVDHWSPWLDLRILAKTLLILVRRSGVSDEGHVTKAVWLGNRAEPQVDPRTPG